MSERPARSRALVTRDGPLRLKGSAALSEMLDAELPPAVGPLWPVRAGWLLRRVEGAEPWNLVPPPFRTRALLVATLPFILADITSVALGGPAGFTFVAFLVTWRWTRAIADMLIRRAMSRAESCTSLEGRARGEVVRLRGRVRAGASFASSGGNWPAVLARYGGTVEHREREDGGRPAPRRSARPWAEVRGVDFLLDVEGGESIVVAVRGAYLLAPAEAQLETPPLRPVDAMNPPLGFVRRRADAGSITETVVAELVVGPGDEVEIWGVLDWEVNPAAVGGPSRRVGLCPVVRGDARAPLVVRAV